MIYESRYYNIRAGQMAKCHEAFQKTIIPIFKKLGVKPVAFWEPTDSNGRIFIYLLGFKDAAAREKAWKDFGTDPDWLKLKAQLGDNAPWEKTQAIVLVPTSYSAQP